MGVSYILCKVFSCLWQENSKPSPASQQQNFARTKCLRVLTTVPMWGGVGWGFHPTNKQYSLTSWLSSTPFCHRLPGESVSSPRSGAQFYKTSNHISDGNKLEVLTTTPALPTTLGWINLPESPIELGKYLLTRPVYYKEKRRTGRDAEGLQGSHPLSQCVPLLRSPCVRQPGSSPNPVPFGFL